MVTGHAAILETRTLRWAQEADCAAFAQALATRPALREACIELRGPLGAGKTTFVRHLLHALGVPGRVKSPTYAVLEPHALPARAGTASRTVAHFDFFRLADPREWEDAGFREVFGAPGLKLAEWPEKAAPLLPTPDWWMELDVAEDDQRRVNVHALTPHGRRLLAQLP